MIGETTPRRGPCRLLQRLAQVLFQDRLYLALVLFGQWLERAAALAAVDAAQLHGVFHGIEHTDLDQRFNDLVGLALQSERFAVAPGVERVAQGDELAGHEVDRAADHPVRPHRQAGEEGLVVAVQRDEVRVVREDAFQLQREANEIIETLVEVGVFNAVKYAMQLRGVDCGQCRGPFKPLTDADKRKVKAVLEKNLGEAL